MPWRPRPRSPAAFAARAPSRAPARSPTAARARSTRRLRAPARPSASRSTRATRSGGRCAPRSAPAATARSSSRRPRPSGTRCCSRASAIRGARAPPGSATCCSRRSRAARTRVLVALGGTATVDGGLGLLGGLGAPCPGDTGAALLGELDLDLAPARALLDGRRADRAARRRRAALRPRRRRALFGPQKGLRAQRRRAVRRGARPASATRLGGDIAQRPGAGAAGGLGAALYWLGAMRAPAATR